MKVLFVVFVGVLYGLALVCLVFPRRVQVLALKLVAAGITSRWTGLQNFIASKQYLLNVRFVGVIALLMGAFLTFAELFGSK